MNPHPAISAILFLCLGTVGAYGQSASKPNISAYNLPASKLALQGYDPVTYIKDGKASKGEAARSATHNGVIYRFSSAENLSAFQADPERYLPAYGGWCATAMAKGEKVEVDPKNFKVTNGRLFLFFNAWYGDAKKAWLKDEAGQEKLADAYWQKISR